MPQQTSYTSAGSYGHSIHSDAEQVNFYVRGGNGGSGNGDVEAGGGNGAEAYGEFDVSDLTSNLDIYVAGDGTHGESGNGGGYNGGGDGGNTSYATGGGGGGKSEVRPDGGGSSTYYILAGGGGGGGAGTDRDGSYEEAGTGGAGGDPDGYDGQDANTMDGGSGGTSGNASGSGGTGADDVYDDQYAAGGGGGGGAGPGGGGQADAALDVANGAGGGGGASAADGSALNTAFTAGVSATEVVVEEQGIPAAPDNVTQTINGDESIEVTWDADTSGASIDSYDVQVSEDGGAWEQVANVDSSTTSYSYTAAASVDTHRFRVRAVNSLDVSDWSYTQTKSTEASNLSADFSAEDEVSLSWGAADDETEYNVLRAESSGASAADYSTVATIAAGSTSYTDTGLEDGENYFYRVEVVYSGTNSLSAEVSGVTVLPGPTDTALDAGTEDEVVVSWTRNDDSADGDVEILRSTDGTAGSVVATLANDATSYTDTPVADGEKYYYTVRRNTDHASTDGAQVSAVTVLPAPSGLTIDALNGDDVDLSWTENADNEDGVRVYYSQDDGETWTQDADLAPDSTTHTVTDLLDGELVRFAVSVYTEHTQSYHTPGLKDVT